MIVFCSSQKVSSSSWDYKKERACCWICWLVKRGIFLIELLRFDSTPLLSCCNCNPFKHLPPATHAHADGKKKSWKNFVALLTSHCSSYWNTKWASNNLAVFLIRVNFSQGNIIGKIESGRGEHDDDDDDDKVRWGNWKYIWDQYVIISCGLPATFQQESGTN